MYDALKIDFNAEHRLAVCRPVGILRVDHASQLLNFLLAFEDSNPEPFNRLLDLSLVSEVRLKSWMIYEYAWARREATAHLPTFRTAIIAPDPSAEEVALIYATLMESSKIQVGVFRGATSVAKWLGVPETVVQSERVHHE
jgi:hypothetical protein